MVDEFTQNHPYPFFQTPAFPDNNTTIPSYKIRNITEIFLKLVFLQHKPQKRFQILDAMSFLVHEIWGGALLGKDRFIPTR